MKEKPMFTIHVEKECGCFKKSDFTNNMKFDDKDNALLQALNMTKEMNQEFCQKHEFEVVEEGDVFKISVDERGKSGCCGGGHCS